MHQAAESSSAAALHAPEATGELAVPSAAVDWIVAQAMHEGAKGIDVPALPRVFKLVKQIAYELDGDCSVAWASVPQLSSRWQALLTSGRDGGPPALSAYEIEYLLVRLPEEIIKYNTEVGKKAYEAALAEERRTKPGLKRSQQPEYVWWVAPLTHPACAAATTLMLGSMGAGEVRAWRDGGGAYARVNGCWWWLRACTRV